MNSTYTVRLCIIFSIIIIIYLFIYFFTLPTKIENPWYTDNHDRHTVHTKSTAIHMRRILKVLLSLILKKSLYLKVDTSLVCSLWRRTWALTLRLSSEMK